MQRTAACSIGVGRCSVERMTLPSDATTTGGAILIGMTAIAAAIRWSVGLLVKANNRAISALVDNSRTHAILAEKFDNLMARFEALAARFDNIVEVLLHDPRLDSSQRARLATRQKTSRGPSSSGRTGDASPSPGSNASESETATATGAGETTESW